MKSVSFYVTNLVTSCCKSLLICTLLILSINSANAQVINEGFEESIWTNFGTGAGYSSSGQVIISGTNSNSGSIMTYLSVQGTTGSSTSYNSCPNTGTWWYSKAYTLSSNSTKLGLGCHSANHAIKVSFGGYIITPVTPAAVLNISIWAVGSPFVIGIANDPNMNQPSYSTGSFYAPGAFSYLTQSYLPTNASMTSFNFSGSFSGPCRIGIFNSGNGPLYIDDITVYAPTGTPPTIVTVAAVPAITKAQVSANLTSGTLPLLATGIIWGTSSSALTGNISDTLLSRTKDIPAATGSFSDIISPLLPSTTYYTEAYALALDGTAYFGSVISFTTQPTTIPLLNTVLPSLVTSIKATVGGIMVDSSGLSINSKGIYYGLSKVTLTNKLPSLSSSDSFSVTIKGLQPQTKYYYRAYASNNKGLGLGTDIDSFTTAAPAPTLTAIPDLIDFGDIIYNTTAPVLSYILTGNNLVPSSGNITINVSPASGFVLSATSTSFPSNSVSSITIPYTNGKFKKSIYIKLLTNNYGYFNSKLDHSGGGVATIDADSISIKGNVIPTPDQLSNMGTDFWTGFGYNIQMRQATTQYDTGATARGAHFSIFIAGSDQNDSVVVDLPGMPNAVGFPRTVFVPANGIVTVGGFPVGDGTPTNQTGAADARLYFTGVSNRGIHIYSKKGIPFSSWIYDWLTADAAGGAMLFPTNTWNSSYVVQAIGGKANSSTYNNNSFFFVIAKDDNTIVNFKPTNDILDNNSLTVFTNMHQHNSTYVKYKKDSTYTIFLNKGQVFNAMGFVGDPSPQTTDSGALDLSGTVVYTSCDKKIAVFGGNGRCLIGTSGSNPSMGNSICTSPSSGSDNLIQQMFPKVAWGTKYLTVPTKNMADNLFRVYVQDSTTNVKLNKVLLSKLNLVNGLYYQFDVNRPSMIEGDKPISVTQFIVSGSCLNASLGNIGRGDPEMITLSPIQQSLKSTTVFAASFKNGNSQPNTAGTYINVVVKGIAGVNSFKLDGFQTGADTGSNSFTGVLYGHSASYPVGITMAQAFKPHPLDNNYYYATFWVTSPAKHTLFCSEGFNAIAYGVSDGESWGYNAGTAINNLSSVKIVQNTYGADTSNSVIHTCKNNPVTLKIALPYLPSQVDSIVWTCPNNPNINLSATSFTGPLMVDPNNPSKYYADTSGVIVKDGQTFYIYTCPVSYQFSDNGLYYMEATAYGSFASDCQGIDRQKMYVQVGSDHVNYSALPAGCGSTSVMFNDNSIAMDGTSIVRWKWDFGDGTSDSSTIVSNPNPTPNPHNYSALNRYLTTLTTLNSAGCFSKYSLWVDLAFGISANFSVAKDTFNVGETVLLNDHSSSNTNKWIMDYGDGTVDTSSINPLFFTHIYKTSGTYILNLRVFSTGGCSSKIYYDTIVVKNTPAITHTVNLNGCNSVTYNGNVYTSSILINDTLKNIYGLDSVYNLVIISVSNNGITGNILHPSKGYVIPNVNTYITGYNIDSVIGQSNYTFNCLPLLGNYTIKNNKNNDKVKANGVSTIDAALIQSHVLGKARLNSPYKIIAADVSNDGKVSALDIVYIKRLILGLDTTFIGKRLWTFVDSSYLFPDTTNPFPYKDSISFTGLSASKINQTFIGMKLGDVNWDWNPAIAKPYNNTINAVELSYEPIKGEKENLVRIPIKVKNFKVMMGMQFTLGFNSEVLRFKGIENNILNIETGTNYTNEGKLSMLWLDPKNEVKTLDDNTQLMVLVFDRAKLSNFNCQLSISSDVTTIEAFDKDFQLHGIVMKPSVISLPEIAQESWVVAPNPTTDGVIHVQMNLKEHKTIVFHLVDRSGKVIMNKKQVGEKGMNNFTLQPQTHLSEGSYYLKADGVEGVKQISIKN